MVVNLRMMPGKKRGRMPAFENSGPGESTAESGGQELFDLVMGKHDVTPGRLARKADYEEPVVAIDRGCKIVADLKR